MTPDAPPTGITAEQALARYREGRDPADLATLFDLTSPDLFRVALHYCSDPAAAEDALQETFLAVVQHADRYEPGRPARPWLAAILRHHASKDRWKRRVPDPARLLTPSAPPDPALDAATAEEMERLRAAMQALPEPYRGVALLRWRYGLEPAQIADVKGVAPGTVWSWLHRAVQRLKVEMGALPALLLAFQGTRGLGGIKGALLRRAAAEAAAPSTAGAAATTAAAVAATGGAVMAGKVAVTVAVVAIAVGVGWFAMQSGGAPTPPSPNPPPPTPPTAEPVSREPPPVPSAPAGEPKSVRQGEIPKELLDLAGSGPLPSYDPATATATIVVRATAKGDLPRMRPIKFDADPKCGAQHAEPVPQETIVARDGRLANVIAWVSKGAEGRTYATPSEPVLLDQHGCMYRPHVFTLQVNQSIAIRNSDSTNHNVHAIPMRKGNEEFNQSQFRGAADLTQRFAKPEVAVKIKCDVHGWMESWAGVLAHPFHGVTGDDGTVQLKVPPGEYEVSVWHEFPRFSKPTAMRVTVGPGETREVDFNFKYDVR